MPLLDVEGRTPDIPPHVGESIHCREPTVCNGIGPFRYSYSWGEPNTKASGSARFQGSSLFLTEYDEGKILFCTVIVSDSGVPGSAPVTVRSNQLGPIGPYVEDTEKKFACIEPPPSFHATDGLNEGSVLTKVSSGNCNKADAELDRYFWSVCPPEKDQSLDYSWTSGGSSDGPYVVTAEDVEQKLAFRLTQRWYYEAKGDTIWCDSRTLNPEPTEDT